MIAASKPLSLIKATALPLVKPTKARNVRMVVRAEKADKSDNVVNSTTDSTVFYGGKNYTAAEWKDAVANGTVVPAPEEPKVAVQPQAMGFGELMAFSGAPEIINGRLAMLGFVAALGAELSSGESVLRQWNDDATGIVLTAITFWIATLIPMLSSSKREAFGPLNPEAEMVNGRAAMIGFASLLVVESLTGRALF